VAGKKSGRAKTVESSHARRKKNGAIVNRSAIGNEFFEGFGNIVDEAKFEREWVAIAKRMETLMQEIERLQERNKRESDPQENRLYRVAFPASTIYVEARSAEQAIDAAADQMVALAKADDWPNSLRTGKFRASCQKKIKRK
jgi:hypothetical protein